MEIHKYEVFTVRRLVLSLVKIHQYEVNLSSNGWCYKLVFLHFNLVLVENNTNISCECYTLLPETGCEIRSLCLCLGRRLLTLIPLRDFISCDRYFWGNLAYVRVQSKGGKTWHHVTSRHWNNADVQRVINTDWSNCTQNIYWCVP